MKQLWTMIADRRRAGPPAFRQKYRQKFKATLSPTLGGHLFLRGFGSRGGGRGPLRAFSSYMGIYYKNIQKIFKISKTGLTIFLKLCMRPYIG